MKVITLCAECAYYSMKKHECTMGAKDESDPRAKFYGDCPLKDGAPVVRCKDCINWGYCELTKYGWGACRVLRNRMRGNDFCSYGERRNK
jgi:hypothetical protein